jgi:hypothetical protein
MKRLLILSMLLCACEKESKVVEAKAVPAAKPASKPAGPPPDLSDEELARFNAKRVMNDWLNAQNQGSFSSYMELYGKSFKGVRRTANGSKKTLDRAAWRADRERMFKKPMEVAAENMTVTTDGKVTTIYFLQRWRSGRYADHGEKIIAFRSNDEGIPQIVSEELRTSKKGWDDTEAADEEAWSPSANEALCAAVVARLATCSDADSRNWISIELHNVGSDGVEDKMLNEEMGGWKTDPEKQCREWKTGDYTSHGFMEDTFLTPAQLKEALGQDCAKVRTVLDEAGGLPKVIGC